MNWEHTKESNMWCGRGNDFVFHIGCYSTLNPEAPYYLTGANGCGEFIQGTWCSSLKKAKETALYFVVAKELNRGCN